MPSIVEGVSVCPLCGDLLHPRDSERPCEVLPYLVRNRLDPLARLHDMVVHVDCLDRDRAAARARRLAELHVVATGGTRCHVCGRDVAAGESFATGVVTSDPTHPLWRANYCLLHRACFQRWELASALRDYCESPLLWQGPALLLTPVLCWDPDWHAPSSGASGRRRVLGGGDGL